MSDLEYRTLFREFQVEPTDALFTKLYALLMRSGKVKDANELIKLYLKDQPYRQFSNNPFDVLSVVYHNIGLVAFGKIKLELKDHAAFLRQNSEWKSYNDNPISIRAFFEYSSSDYPSCNKQEASKCVKGHLNHIAKRILIKNDRYELSDLIICEAFSAKNRRQKRDYLFGRKALNYIEMADSKPRWIPRGLQEYYGHSRLVECRGVQTILNSITIPGERY